MNKTKNTEYKRRYAMAKHHAWAGSVLLAILGALRWFAIDISYPQTDLIFIIAGLLLILYILIALIFTYRFRSGLSTKEVIVTQQSNSNQSSTQKETSSLTTKERAKIEKKKAKAEAKKLKKLAKAQEKQKKKSN